MYNEPCTLGENYLPPLQNSSCAHVCWLLSLCHVWSYARHNKDDIQYALRGRRQLQCVQRPSSLYAHYYDLLHLWFCQWRHSFHPWETDAMLFYTKNLSIFDLCSNIRKKFERSIRSQHCFPLRNRVSTACGFWQGINSLRQYPACASLQKEINTCMAH